MRRFAVIAAVFAIVTAIALPAAAGPASTETVEDFYTAALDAEGNFKLVWCEKAHQVVQGDTAKEKYTCEFVDSEFLGAPVLPQKAMKWDYESTDGLVDENIAGLVGPYRWFSDIEDMLYPDSCFWYSTDWRMVITPSGRVNVNVVYDPIVAELPDGSACP